VYHDRRQRFAATLPALPVTPTPDLNAWSNFDQTLFWRRQMNSPWQKEAGDRLYMSATQTTPRTKRLANTPVMALWQLMSVMIF
jgi:hypothetical protein